MSSLLGGAIGGAIVVCMSTRLKELKVKNGCAYVIDKLSKVSDSLRPAAVRVAKGGLVVKERIKSDLETLREELKEIMEEAREADQGEEGAESASRKKEQLRSQLMSDLETLREELDDVMEGVREADHEEGVEVLRRKKKPVPVKKEKVAVKERIKSDLGTVREELKEIMEEAREAQKEESVRAPRPDSVDERLKEVEKHLKTLDEKPKKKPVKQSAKRKPSKKSGAAR